MVSSRGRGGACLWRATKSLGRRGELGRLGAAHASQGTLHTLDSLRLDLAQTDRAKICSSKETEVWEGNVPRVDLRGM